MCRVLFADRKHCLTLDDVYSILCSCTYKHTHPLNTTQLYGHAWLQLHMTMSRHLDVDLDVLTCCMHVTAASVVVQTVVLQTLLKQ